MVIWEYPILSYIRVIDFNGKLDSLILTLYTLAHTNKAPKVSLIVAKGSFKLYGFVRFIKPDPIIIKLLND